MLLFHLIDLKTVVLRFPSPSLTLLRLSFSHFSVIMTVFCLFYFLLLMIILQVLSGNMRLMWPNALKHILSGSSYIRYTITIAVTIIVIIRDVR